MGGDHPVLGIEPYAPKSLVFEGREVKPKVIPDRCGGRHGRPVLAHLLTQDFKRGIDGGVCVAVLLNHLFRGITFHVGLLGFEGRSFKAQAPFLTEGRGDWWGGRQKVRFLPLCLCHPPSPFHKERRAVGGMTRGKNRI